MQKLSDLAARLVHPATWWLVGFSVAILAGQSTNFFILLALISASVGAILLFRSSAPWARSLPFYLLLAGFVILTRILFRVLFNSDASAEDVVLNLPSLEVPMGFETYLTLLGPVSASTIWAATIDGLRLGAIILAIAMANTLSNPRKLLKSTPAALYEIAAAVSVAINLAPQLIDSLQRVRRAKALRGRNSGSGTLVSIVIPALEDTFERSLALAASMDSRGFGRNLSLSKRRQWATRTLSLGVAVGLAIGAYLLVASSDNLLAAGVIAASLSALFAVIRLTAKRNIKTRFAKQRLTLVDAGMLCTCVLLLAIGFSAPLVQVGF